MLTRVWSMWSQSPGVLYKKVITMTGSKVNDESPVKDRYRRINKPLMERRRRERINGCLSQLKNIVLEKMYKNESKISKLEKADILEMTVQYLQNIQQQLNNASDLEMQRKYEAGFSKCATEVVQFLDNTNIDRNVRSSLGCHLNRCVRNIGARVTEHYTGNTNHSENDRICAVVDASDVRRHHVLENTTHLHSENTLTSVEPINYSKNTINTRIYENRVTEDQSMCESLPAFRTRLYQTYFDGLPEETETAEDMSILKGNDSNDEQNSIDESHSNNESDSNVWRPW